MRKAVLFSILFLCISSSISAKIKWVYDMQTAKAMTLSENKLIVIDFWATWCGPCNKMELEFWSTDEVKGFENNMIFLKVDVDTNRALAQQYGVRGIPYVVVADIIGNKIWDIVGYNGPNYLSKVLKNIPVNIEAINKAALPFVKDSETDEDYVKMGRAYADIALEIDNDELKSDFFSMSNKMFKKAKKSDYSDEVELRILLNKAYLGHTKKLMKKINKIPETNSNKKLRDFVIDYVKNAEK